MKDNLDIPLQNRPTLRDEMRRWREANPDRRKDFREIQGFYEDNFDDMGGPHEIKKWLEAHPSESQEALTLAFGITFDGQINGRGELETEDIAEELGLTEEQVVDLLDDRTTATHRTDTRVPELDIRRKLRQPFGTLNESISSARDDGIRQGAMGGVLEDYAGYAKPFNEELPAMEAHVKELYQRLDSEELEIMSRIMGFDKEGNRQPSSTMQQPEEIAEELGMTQAEVMTIATRAVQRFNPSGTAEEWLDRVLSIKEEVLEERARRTDETIVEQIKEGRYGLNQLGTSLNRRFFYEPGHTLIGADPATMKTPMEVDDWVGAIVHWQATMIKQARSTEGQQHLKDFMNIEEPVAHLAEYKAQEAIAPRGVPESISRRFPRLALNSLKGELHATTKRMVEAAEARVGDYDYAWLQPEELPAESGLVIIPEGVWELDWEGELTSGESTYSGAGQIAALSWTCVAGGVLVCFWDEIEYTERRAADIHHVWFCDMNVGGYGNGPLLNPHADDYQEKFDELGMGDFKDEWETMLDRLTESWMMIAKGSEMIRMLGEELLFAQQRRPQFADKNTKRQTKKVLEEIPDILIYDLRRYSVNPTGPNDGESIPREYSHSFDVRGHPRVLDRGTPEERTIWVRPHRKAVDKPYIKKDRIGVLRR